MQHRMDLALVLKACSPSLNPWFTRSTTSSGVMSPLGGRGEHRQGQSQEQGYCARANVNQHHYWNIRTINNACNESNSKFDAHTAFGSKVEVPLPCWPENEGCIWLQRRSLPLWPLSLQTHKLFS